MKPSLRLLLVLMVTGILFALAGCGEDSVQDRIPSGGGSSGGGGPPYNIGNDVPFFFGTINFSIGFLQAKGPLTVPTPTNVIKLAVMVNATQIAGNLRMALYADSLGYPGALVVGSVVQAIPAGAGVHEFSVTPTAIPAGTYWFAHYHDVMLSMDVDGASETYIAVGGYAVGDPLPGTFPATLPGPINKSNWYIVVQD